LIYAKSKLYRATNRDIFSGSTDAGYLVVFAALGFVSWPHDARLIRGQVLSIHEREYVLAAESVGVSARG
jgi:peptide/nickel transport system permease protein